MSNQMMSSSMRCAVAIAVLASCTLAIPTNTEIMVEDPKSFSISSTINEWWGRSAVAKKDTVCETLDWRTSSMKLLKEIPAAGLFEDLKGTTKWEISGMVVVNKMIHMIFDNLAHIGQVDERFQYLAPENALIEHATEKAEEDSLFESIEYSPSTDTYIITREAVAHPKKEGAWSASILEAKINGKGSGASYSTVMECHMDFEFTSENKGIEGGAYFDKDGKRYFLGLCEGNHCKGGAEGRDPGNGRIIVTYLEEAKGDQPCQWTTEKVINIPPQANFQDYADISILGNKIAIVSQEAAAIWVGNFNLDKFEVTGPGDVYHFPKNDDCETIYCNVEGISFLDHFRIAAATDRSKATQPYNCVPHDQSVMVFQLPKPIKDDTPKWEF